MEAIILAAIVAATVTYPVVKCNFASPIPSFVNYRDSVPQTPLLFSPVNMSYKEFRIRGEPLGGPSMSSKFPVPQGGTSNFPSAPLYEGTVFQTSPSRFPSSFPPPSSLPPLPLQFPIRNHKPFLRSFPAYRSLIDHPIEQGRVVRQKTIGSEAFLGVNSNNVHRNEGEGSSVEGYLGQRYRSPVFVSAVGTPVAGVAQNILYTGNSVQASKLDEVSDVVGVDGESGAATSLSRNLPLFSRDVLFF